MTAQLHEFGFFLALLIVLALCIPIRVRRLKAPWDTAEISQGGEIEETGATAAATETATEASRKTLADHGQRRVNAVQQERRQTPASGEVVTVRSRAGFSTS